MNRKRRFACLTVAFGLFLTAVAVDLAVSQSSDPKGTVEILLGAVEALSKGSEDHADPALTRKVSQTIDVSGISQSCLQETWQKIAEGEKQNFVGLFRQLLEEVAYPKSAKFFKNTKVEIEEVKLDGANAEVFTAVTHPEEGMVEVAYCLRLLQEKWLVEDVLLDGVSLVTDLRSQMQKILREKSYEELKRRMREKLD